MIMLSVTASIVVLGVLWWGSQILILRGLAKGLVKTSEGWAQAIRAVLFLNLVMSLIRATFKLDTLLAQLLSMFLSLFILDKIYDTSWERVMLISFLLGVCSLLSYLLILVLTSASIRWFA